MNNPIITIHNAETNEVEIREMNAEELAQWKIDQADAATKQEAQKEVATAKAALLDRLGITEEEAKLLLA
jgi:AmiR/NasT family two-component response regulator